VVDVRPVTPLVGQVPVYTMSRAHAALLRVKGQGLRVKGQGLRVTGQGLRIEG